jgi:Protein of unknown function (DUF4240)
MVGSSCARRAVRRQRRAGRYPLISIITNPISAATFVTLQVVEGPSFFGCLVYANENEDELNRLGYAVEGRELGPEPIETPEKEGAEFALAAHLELASEGFGIAHPQLSLANDWIQFGEIETPRTPMPIAKFWRILSKAIGIVARGQDENQASPTETLSHDDVVAFAAQFNEMLSTLVNSALFARATEEFGWLSEDAGLYVAMALISHGRDQLELLTSDPNLVFWADLDVEAGERLYEYLNIETERFDNSSNRPERTDAPLAVWAAIEGRKLRLAVREQTAFESLGSTANDALTFIGIFTATSSVLDGWSATPLIAAIRLERSPDR